MQAAAAGEETGVAGGHAVQWVDGWMVGGGLSSWRMSVETGACLPESWSPAWGEGGVRSCHGGSGSPRGESAWPDPPACREGGRAPAWAWRPWGWGAGVPGREAPGGESFQAGWGFRPQESRPHPGAWSRVGTIGGHTGGGEHLACLSGPRGLPCCSCSQRAQGLRLMSCLQRGPRGLARAPTSTLPASAPPGHPGVTEWAGTVSWAASRGLPESPASSLGRGSLAGGRARPPSGVWGGL